MNGRSFSPIVCQARHQVSLAVCVSVRILPVILVLMMVSGCLIVGPTYETPDLSSQYQSAWKTDRASGDTTSLVDGPTTDAWWEQFDDPELERLIIKLAQSNLQLAQARERIVEARARRGIANAEQLPTLDVGGAVVVAGTPEDGLPLLGPQSGNKDVTLFVAGALAGWEVDLWGRVKRLVEAADRDIDANLEDYRHVLVSLFAEMTLAYVDARALEHRLIVLDRNIKLLTKSMRLAKSRFRAGLGTELDVTQASRLLSQTRADRPTLLRAKEVAYHRIAVLLGIPPFEGVISNGQMPTPPKVVGMRLPADLITRRADVRRAERQYAATVAKIGMAVAEQYPRLSLNGLLTFVTEDAGKLFQPASLLYALAPNLTFPLFDAGRITNNIRIRESESEQARLSLQQTLLDAVKEVEDAAVGVIQNQQRVHQLRQATADARHSVVLAEQLYKVGLGSLFQLIDTQRQLVAIEDRLLIAQQNELGEIVRLYRALGGGWTAMPDVETVSTSEERKPG